MVCDNGEFWRSQCKPRKAKLRCSSLELLQVMLCKWKVTYGLWSASLWQWQMWMLVFVKKSHRVIEGARENDKWRKNDTNKERWKESKRDEEKTRKKKIVKKKMKKKWKTHKEMRKNQRDRKGQRKRKRDISFLFIYLNHLWFHQSWLTLKKNIFNHVSKGFGNYFSNLSLLYILHLVIFSLVWNIGPSLEPFSYSFWHLLLVFMLRI